MVKHITDLHTIFGPYWTPTRNTFTSWIVTCVRNGIVG